MAKAGAVLKFRFRTNAQNQTATREGLNSLAQNFANLLVNQVALSAREKSFRAAKQRLVSSATAAVNREIAQMSFMVQKFLVQPRGVKGPSGTLTAFDKNVSNQARQLRWGYSTTQYDLRSAGVSWVSRTFKYMLWKEKSGHSTDWWMLKGDLRATLSKQSFYTQNFGPVKVEFISSSATGDIKNVTSTGPGRVTTRLNVGTLSVSVMGRITPAMLPAIGGEGDPTQAVGYGGSHVTDLVMDRVTRSKLSRGPEGKYRPVLEPFLAYYLTRAIPNAVFRVIENTINDNALYNASQTGKKARQGIEDFTLG